jgi:hypothetical protein
LKEPNGQIFIPENNTIKLRVTPDLSPTLSSAEISSINWENNFKVTILAKDGTILPTPIELDNDTEVAMTWEDPHFILFNLSIDEDVTTVEIEISDSVVNVGSTANLNLIPDSDFIYDKEIEEIPAVLDNLNSTTTRVVIATAASGAAVTSIATGAGSTSIVYLIKLF